MSIAIKMEVARVVKLHDGVHMRAGLKLGGGKGGRDLILIVEEPGEVGFLNLFLDGKDVVFIRQIDFQVSCCQLFLEIIEIACKGFVSGCAVPLKGLVDLLEECVVLEVGVGDHLDDVGRGGILVEQVYESDVFLGIDGCCNLFDVVPSSLDHGLSSCEGVVSIESLDPLSELG
jgi:hypothetical protein